TGDGRAGGRAPRHPQGVRRGRGGLRRGGVPSAGAGHLAHAQTGARGRLAAAGGARLRSVRHGHRHHRARHHRAHRRSLALVRDASRSERRGRLRNPDPGAHGGRGHPPPPDLPDASGADDPMSIDVNRAPAAPDRVTSPPGRRAAILGRIALYGLAIFFALWVLLPIYFITIAAFSTPDDVFTYPKNLLPTGLSTETLEFFFGASGILDALRMSVIVAGL